MKADKIMGATAYLSQCQGSQVPADVQLLAQRGLTVVAALDAPTPTDYALLDRVLVLQQGRTLYLGGPGNNTCDVCVWQVECLPRSIVLSLMTPSCGMESASPQAARCGRYTCR